MHLCTNARPSGWAALFLLSCLALARCTQQQPAQPADTFFKDQDAAHNGDYLATYPLHNPDSCILRLKAEVPAQHQPWACLSLWYHLPRTSPQVSFRLLELYDQNYPHDTVFAFTQMVRGEFLTEMRQHDSARTVLADARGRYLRLHRPLDASDADYLVARCYFQENNPAMALETYFRVLDLVNSHDTTFSHRHVSLYLDLASTYSSTKDFSKEQFWLKKAWNGDTSRLTEAWKYQVRIALKLSANYAQTSRFDSSLVMANLASDLFRAHSQKPLPAELAYRLGFAHFKKGDCATALPLFLEASRRTVNSPNSFMKNQIEQGLGEAYLCLNRLDSAAIFFQKALTTPDTGNLAAAHHRLADIHARQGNFQAAYTAEKESLLMFKSAFALEKATALSEFEARYQTAQKERRIERLESQRKIAEQRSLLVGLSLLLVAGGLLALFLRQRNRRRLLEQHNQLLAQEKELAEARELLKTAALERAHSELQHTQGALNTSTKLLAIKNQLIEELKMRLTRRHLAPAEGDAPSPAENPDLNGIKILNDADWSRFRERFDQQVPGFIHQLKVNYPALTTAEVRLCLLTKLHFNSVEIAQALGISKDSVYRSRHRLSKKLGLADTGDLDGFVEGLG